MVQINHRQSHNMKRKALFFWSGGKDSALALHEILTCGEYDVSALVTTVNAGSDRVGIHGLRSVLLDKQAESIGLPLEKIYIPKDASNEIYEAALEKTLLKHKNTGAGSVV
jgi:diphthamide synthase (EF-2-diphthine--ammonia ligase)